jgi:hypothetical protein
MDGSSTATALPPPTLPTATNHPSANGHGATPNPLSAPVAQPPPPPVNNAHPPPAPLAMPPGTMNAPAPPLIANGHPMPTHYQHQSQAMAPAPPLAQQLHHPPSAQPMQQMQQQVAQQSQARPQPLNGGWQSDKDVDDRRKMIAKM